MEAELKEAFPDAKIELVEGDGGIFDIMMDDSLIYQKDRGGGRFPCNGEIARLVREMS